MSDTERDPNDAIDHDLIRRIRQGDPQAQSDLHQRYAGRLLAWLTSECRNRDDAEDMAQEVWTRVFTRLDSFTYGRFATWLFHIARNYRIDMARKPQRTHQLKEGSMDQFTGAASPAAPQSAVERDPRFEAMTHCLQQLDSVFVRTIKLVKLDGVAIVDVAATERVTVITISTRINRGLRQLQACIEGKLS